MSHRAFRMVWSGTMASNIGTWMQNVALGALAYKLGGTSFVALIGFVQLGPILFLANIGGSLADRFDRKKIVMAMNAEQLLFSVALAWIASPSHQGRDAIIACVLAIGIGNAIQGPSYASYMPSLVPKADLPGAISLFSVQLNLSRVVGPAIGGLLLPFVGFRGLFLINAATYLFAIAAVAYGPAALKAVGTPERGILAGFRIVRDRPELRTPLLAITAMSFFCLPFVGLMPPIAKEHLGIDPKSTAYGFLYGSFGLGAAVGAMAVGTVLVGRDRGRIVRFSFLLFAVFLAAWGTVRSAPLAFPVAFCLGATYFVVPTSLSTSLQEHLADIYRGRVMALYMMGFGGTVPLGILFFGRLAAIHSVGLAPVLIVGSIAAVAMAFLVRLGGPPEPPTAEHHVLFDPDSDVALTD